MFTTEFTVLLVLLAVGFLIPAMLWAVQQRARVADAVRMPELLVFMPRRENVNASPYRRLHLRALAGFGATIGGICLGIATLPKRLGASGLPLVGTVTKSIGFAVGANSGTESTLPCVRLEFDANTSVEQVINLFHSSYTGY